MQLDVLIIDFFLLTKYGTYKELLLYRLKGVAQRSSVSHMKHHVKFTNERVLTMIVEVLECKNAEWYICHSQYMVFFV